MDLGDVLFNDTIQITRKKSMPKTLPLSYIEISKENLIHNIKQFKSLVKPGTQVVSVVKANAYGHGQNEVAKILEPYTDAFMVNSINELAVLRTQTKKKTFILGYVASPDIIRAIDLGCVLSVFSLEHLKLIESSAKKMKKVVEAHVAIDAHLGREGIMPKEIELFLFELKKCKWVQVTGVYAHFANIEDTENFTHAEKQIAEYEKTITLFEKHGFKNLQTHISATSGILMYEKNKGVNSIVRLGIGLYGFWPSDYIEYLYKKKITLKPVLLWKTKVAQVKIIPAGETIGYGLSYLTKHKTKIAVIPQGYSDGLDRKLSNKGEVLISGKRCKILGRMAMNMFVVDVSYLKQVKAEDEVVIVGTQGKQQITAGEIAETIGTIHYEFVARLSALLPRVVK
jgi:alanine racemase